MNRRIKITGFIWSKNLCKKQFK